MRQLELADRRVTPVRMLGWFLSFVAMVCIAAGVGAAGEFATTSLVLILATGAAVSFTAWWRRAGARSAPVGRAGVPWLVWLLVLALWELFTFESGVLPTLSDFGDLVLVHPWARGTATFLWVAGGLWLMRRQAPGNGGPS